MKNIEINNFNSCVMFVCESSFNPVVISVIPIMNMFIGFVLFFIIRFININVNVIIPNIFINISSEFFMLCVNNLNKFVLFILLFR